MKTKLTKPTDPSKNKKASDKASKPNERVYLKIFNENDRSNHSENDKQIKYKSNKWNEDVYPFNSNPSDSCCRGGLYYTHIENIHHFIFSDSYGNFIRQVEPNEETIKDDNGNTLSFIVKDKNKSRGTKWRTNKLYLYSRKDLREASTWEWLISLGFDIEAKDNSGNTALMWASRCEYKEVVEVLESYIKKSKG